MPDVLSPTPRLPAGLRIYAIGDIHGCADLLRQLFAVIDADLKHARENRVIHVFLGDYIDRGPNARETLDLLVDRSRRHESVFLRGNHEAVLDATLRNSAELPTWQQFGGFQTLLSYGLKPSFAPDQAECNEIVRALDRVMPRAHKHFIRTLRLFFSCGDYFFVHAGARPGIPLRRQTASDLLWIREEFLQTDHFFGQYIVHGHTPVPRADRRKYRINIDTGAYATGNLTLLTMTGGSMLAI